MTQLYEIKVSLSPNQKKNLSNAYHKRETIVLRLTKDSLSGNDTLYVPQNIVKRLDKNRKLKKGMDIKLAKTNIRKQVGGSLLSTVLNLGRTFVPTIAKTLGLSALAGAASEGASQIVKKISGKGIQTGGFLIPQNKINQLIAYKHLLTTKQKQDILNALQTGSGVHIKPTKVQTGGFLGTLLASIGVPLAIEAIKKITGNGSPRMEQPKPPKSIPKPTTGGLFAPMYRTPPFYGNWPDSVFDDVLLDSDQTSGMGIKKKQKKSSEKRKRSTIRQELTIQKRPSSEHSVVKPKFHQNIPLSNHDLIDWCKYLNIPIKDVLSRDESVPHNHREALFIHNLEPSYMSGSHWVSTYVKDNVINYFDSFGLPPFQEIVNHARKKNLTLLHQNNQIQNLMTTTCGYFCLYFLNEMNKGKSYFDPLEVFDIYDTTNNEKFLEQYFKNI